MKVQPISTKQKNTSHLKSLSTKKTMEIQIFNRSNISRFKYSLFYFTAWINCNAVAINICKYSNLMHFLYKKNVYKPNPQAVSGRVATLTGLPATHQNYPIFFLGSPVDYQSSYICKLVSNPVNTYFFLFPRTYTDLQISTHQTDCSCKYRKNLPVTFLPSYLSCCEEGNIEYEIQWNLSTCTWKIRRPD